MRTNKLLDPFVTQLFQRYECVPTKLKYMFIEKDFTRMFGKVEGLNHMRYMYDDTETFIFAFENTLFEFSSTIRKNLIKKYWEDLALDEYIKIAESGSYFKYYSGKWSNDKKYFIDKVVEREKDKEYLKLILE